LSRLETAGDFSFKSKVFLEGSKIFKDTTGCGPFCQRIDISWKNMCPLLYTPIPLIGLMLDKFKAECREAL
jgi:hypothetical protein